MDAIVREDSCDVHGRNIEPYILVDAPMYIRTGRRNIEFVLLVDAQLRLGHGPRSMGGCALMWARGRNRNVFPHRDSSTWLRATASASQYEHG